ncbi:MAG: hypothetical protein NZT92_11985 [Abditibacteriales bacterium]|nr:hypothetical protein [Abditibacteriales bacterium]MDW8366664.1 hypothetical protein [Abditibacteriales bacterium]
MSKTISLDELPRKAKRLLRAVWEEQESIILERNGEPVATVAPVGQRTRMADGERQKGKGKRKKTTTTVEPSKPPLTYELPSGLLAAYHRLVSKKLAEGLTPDEEAELGRVEEQLDEAELATPLGQYINAKAEREHARRMARLDELIAKLKALQAYR